MASKRASSFRDDEFPAKMRRSEMAASAGVTHVGGISDGQLLKKAEAMASRNGAVSLSDAKDLWQEACNAEVSGTELVPTGVNQALEQALSSVPFTSAAAKFLRERIGTGKLYYTMQRDGIAYARDLLQKAEMYDNEGPISYPEARDLWESAFDSSTDPPTVTGIERKTLHRALVACRFSPRAETFLRDCLGNEGWMTPYVVVDGVQYDRQLMDRASGVVAGAMEMTEAQARSLVDFAFDGKATLATTERRTLGYIAKTMACNVLAGLVLQDASEGNAMHPPAPTTPVMRRGSVTPRRASATSPRSRSPLVPHHGAVSIARPQDHVGALHFPHAGMPESLGFRLPATPPRTASSCSPTRQSSLEAWNAAPLSAWPQDHRRSQLFAHAGFPESLSLAPKAPGTASGMTVESSFQASRVTTEPATEYVAKWSSTSVQWHAPSGGDGAVDGGVASTLALSRPGATSNMITAPAGPPVSAVASPAAVNLMELPPSISTQAASRGIASGGAIVHAGRVSEVPKDFVQQSCRQSQETVTEYAGPMGCNRTASVRDELATCSSNGTEYWSFSMEQHRTTTIERVHSRAIQQESVGPPPPIADHLLASALPDVPGRSSAILKPAIDITGLADKGHANGTNGTSLCLESGPHGAKHPEAVLQAVMGSAGHLTEDPGILGMLRSEPPRHGEGVMSKTRVDTASRVVGLQGGDKPPMTLPPMPMLIPPNGVKHLSRMEDTDAVTPTFGGWRFASVPS